MRKQRIGIDTTDWVVYGHEAWIVTDKSRYEPGETVRAVLRWGHNMRPDGFCRTDEFRIFAADEQGNQEVLTPVKGDGDYYDFFFVPKHKGVYTIMSVYDNTYGRDENDEYFEGTRQDLPDILEVINYLQIYSVNISVGVEGGSVPFIDGSRASFVPVNWESDIKGMLKLRLVKDKIPVSMASVTVVQYDGKDYFERVLVTDRNGEVFFDVSKPGIYFPIYRTGFNEPMEGYYESKEVTVSYTYIKR